MPGPEPRVRAVVLSWRSADQVMRCADSLLASEGVAVDVVVVDNHSGDGSARILAERYGRDRVLALEENVGYAGGMNAGLEASLHASSRTHEPAQFLLFVTQDVEVPPDAVRRLCAAAERPGVGVAGPRVFYHGDPPRLMNAGFRLSPRRVRMVPLRVPEADAVVEVDTIDGCCLLVRKEVVDRIGGFDDRFFMYFEETDFCHRAAQAGWKVVVDGRARVFQEKHGAPGPHYSYYMARNAFLFWRKNFGVARWRIGLRLVLDTVRLAASTALLFLRGRGGEGRESLLRLARQLRGHAHGVADHLRGRYGRMPGHPG